MVQFRSSRGRAATYQVTSEILTGDSKRDGVYSNHPMAREKSSGTSSALASLTRMVAACRSGTPAPVYLFVGDSPDTRQAAEALVEELVPPERRSFNVERYDGRTVPMSRVLDSLRTPAFFPGVKVVWVGESPAFLSGAKKGDLAKSMRTAWEGGRQREAAEKLVTLLALAGWTSTQMVEADWLTMKKTAMREVFGDDIRTEDTEQIQAIHQVAVARGIEIADFRDDAAVLLEHLERPVVPDAVLVFTVAAADARKRVVKRLNEVGEVLEFVVERERSGALTRDSIATIARERAAAFDKQLEAAALDLVVRRASNDAGSLKGELDKLCLYVGVRKRITAADVRAVVLDMAEAWIFDFTGGLAARDLERTLPVLRGLLAQGEPPLRILALVARELRLLLVARECIAELGPNRWRRGMAYPAFQSKILPAIDAETMAAFGKPHPFALFRRFEDASRTSVTALRRALVELATLDSRFKSSGGDQGILLESFVVGFCR